VDTILGTIPVLLFIYPIASWIMEAQRNSRLKDDLDGAAEMEEDEEFDSTAPLVPLVGRRQDREQ
jgi:hypothetical protein